MYRVDVNGSVCGVTSRDLSDLYRPPNSLRTCQTKQRSDLSDHLLIICSDRTDGVHDVGLDRLNLDLSAAPYSSLSNH